MPDATITSTASTFGTITGTFAADQSTIVGTVTGIVAGTLDGSVGVPGPVGPTGPQGPEGPPGPPGEGGTWGSIVGTLSNQLDLQAALDLKAPLASPVFTGDARAVTPAFGDNDTSISTTAFVQAALAGGTAVAKNLEVYVRNQSGSTIPAGSIVYISGATGNRPLITLAQANNDANSAQTIGFVKESIANNGFGYVMVRGELENIDTSALTEGVQLYLSPTTAGAWTTTKPSAPQHLVYVGIVIRSHPTQGVILVAVQNGYELDELHDVAIASKANNDLLAYESSTNLWKNKTFSALGLLTSADAASTYYLASNPAGYQTAGQVSTALTPYLLSSTASAIYQTQAAMSAYLTTSAAAAGYYPLTGNPSGFLTSASLSGYATQAWVDAQGYLQAGALTGYALESWVTSQGYLTSASLTGYATESWVTAGFYPLTGNPSGFIDSSALTGYATESWVYALGYLTDAPIDGNQYVRLNGAWSTLSVPADYITSVSSPLSVTAGDLSIDLSAYAPKASPSLTGSVTITTNSTSPALFIEQAGTGDILTLHDQVSDTTFVAIDQTGKIGTIASTTANAGFNVPHGSAPTAPVNGDIWTTTSGLFMRQNGSTKQYVDLDGTQTINGTKTFSAANQTLGNATATGTINLATGATLSGSTKTVNIGTSGVSGSTTLITVGPVAGASTTTIGATTASSTLNLATGATLSGSTKTINIGTSGVLGSTNVINIGPTATSGTINFNNNSVSLGSNSTASTAAADTNTTQLATTAFVVGQAGSATPLVDGTAAVGTSLRYARQDHVHPTDTSRAALASPTFTGVPAAPTAAVDTNTTQIATTAYVVGQGYLKSATASSTYAPLASPALTGTPTAPTATAGTNTTQIATTAFVLANAGSTSFATTAEVVAGTSTTTALAPANVGFLVANPRLQPLAFINNSALSGSGANTTTNPQNFSRQVYLSSLAIGRAAFSFGAIGAANAGFGTSTAKADQVDFSKKVWLSGYACMGWTTPGTNYIGDANTICRITLGGYSSNTTGDMTLKGIGLKKVGGSSSFVNLTVHNGTTRTDVASSVTVPDGGGIHWMIYSDGTGNVTLYINGTQAATTTAGPTTATASGQACYREQVEAVSTPGVRQAMNCNGGWFYTE